MKIKRNRESGHMGHESEWEPPGWVKALVWFLVLGMMLAAARCSVRAQPGPPGWATNLPPAKPSITDLGVITPDTIIQLKPCERRKDFAMFKVEILPRNARGWTNKVVIQTTNDFLRIDDLAAVPEGHAIMGVRSYCSNGDASAVALFRIDVQRDLPDPPKAEVSHVLRNRTEQKIEHVIDNMSNQATPPPPAPPGMTNKPSAVPTRTHTRTEPLPGGHAETYAQYQARLEKAFASGERVKNMR
jgi:hypothetical protein